MRKSLLILASFGLLYLPINAQQSDSDAKHEWLPGTVCYYNWWDSEWLLGVENKYTYNEQGLATRIELSDETIEDREYYEDGYIKAVTTSEQIDGDWVVTSKITYAYDEIVAGYVTENLYYQLNDADELVLYNGIRNILTRNADGNIVANETMRYSKSAWALRTKYIIQYGSDGTASSIKSESYDPASGECTGAQDIVWDIVWEATDGQIVAQSWQSLLAGANRIKTASVPGLEATAKLSVEYPSEGSYEYTVEQDDKILSSMTYVLMDDLKSYETTSITNNYSVSESGTAALEFRSSSKAYSKSVLDAFNYPLYVLTENYDDDKLVFSQERTADPTYDDEYGYPLQYVFSVSLNCAPAEYYQKIVLSDYVATAGLGDVVADENAAAEYFNIQGIKVANPKAGLYIRRLGNKVEKILVK